ncbi:hypothetical protein GCM10022237_09030 [Nocardioides ginsengisoli]|uniref:Uncharacterized protein n=1 Tax=Nocardioides ginsengisoli TaxID=363868 RepID=A0ABW3W0A0_9ACTN
MNAVARPCVVCGEPLAYSGRGRPPVAHAGSCARTRANEVDEGRRSHRMAAMLTDPDSRGSAPLPHRDVAGHRWSSDFDPDTMSVLSLPRRDVLALGEHPEKTHTDEAEAFWEARVEAARRKFRDLDDPADLVGVTVLRSWSETG